mgnify:CR=1 FL=1
MTPPLRAKPISATPRSITESQAVLARLGAADQYAALVIDPDRLAASERHLLDRDLMTAIGEILGDRQAVSHARPAAHRAAAGSSAARQPACGIHAPIQHAVQEMGMPDRLILPAHDPERHYRAAVLDEHPGMIVWNGRLPGAMALGWPGIVRKPVPRLCSRTPLCGAKMPVPKLENSELMNEQAFPSRSTTQR